MTEETEMSFENILEKLAAGVRSTIKPKFVDYPSHFFNKYQAEAITIDGMKNMAKLRNIAIMLGFKTPEQIEQELEDRYPSYKKMKQVGSPGQIEAIRALIR